MENIEIYLKQLCEANSFAFMNHIKKDKQGLKFIIGCLYISKDKKVYAGDLAKISCVSTARIAATINKLEKLGLVVRLQSKEDARKTEIKLTNLGIQKAIEMKKHLLNFLQKIVDDIGIEDFKQYVEISKKINFSAAKIIKESGDINV